MNYTGMLYTLWYIVAVEISSYASRLSPRDEQVVDGVLSLLLLIGGICLAASDYLDYCDYIYHCHNLTAAAAFTFIGMFCFLASLTLSFLTSGPTKVLEQYNLEMTPSDALSPIQGSKAENNV